MMVRLFVMILTLLVPLMAGAADASGKDASTASPPTFAVIPFYSPEKIWALYNPFIKYLRQSTGDLWQLQLFNNHSEFIEGICSGKVTVALLGPVPLMKAYESCGVKPFLVALGKDGTPFYRSVVVTNDPAVKNLAGLIGKRIGFFKGSTAAHVVPLRMLEKAGLKQTDFSPVFLGSQDQIIQRLLSGEIDAAGVKENLAGKFARERLNSIASSEPLPNFALSAAPSAPGPVIQRLKSALTRLNPSMNKAHARLVHGWDEEIRQGFTLPGTAYLSSLQNFNRAIGDAK